MGGKDAGEWIDAEITMVYRDATYDLEVNDPRRWAVAEIACRVPHSLICLYDEEAFDELIRPRSHIRHESEDWSQVLTGITDTGPEITLHDLHSLIRKAWPYGKRGA